MGNKITGELMPRYCYIVRFNHVDGSPSESYQYYDQADACHHFNLFDDSDGELYSSIELIEHDFLEKKSRLLCISCFMEKEDEDEIAEAETTTDEAANDECFGDCEHCSVSEGCEDYDETNNTLDDLTTPDDGTDDYDPAECEGCEYVKFFLKYHRQHPDFR